MTFFSKLQQFTNKWAGFWAILIVIVPLLSGGSVYIYDHFASRQELIEKYCNQQANALEIEKKTEIAREEAIILMSKQILSMFIILEQGIVNNSEESSDESLKKIKEMVFWKDKFSALRDTAIIRREALMNEKNYFHPESIAKCIANVEFDHIMVRE